MKEGKCIMGEMRKDREKITDTSVLIETYEKEIWKLKELLSRALQDTNTLEGTKRIVVELSKEKINLKKKCQELENEMILIKGITVINSPELREANKKIVELHNSLERLKKENNDLLNRIADALDVNESHHTLNGKLQERLTELEEENKKMHDYLNKRIDASRKAGL